MIAGDEEAITNVALLFLFIVGIPCIAGLLCKLIDRWKLRDAP